jgi:hypothetical protein
LLIKITSNTRGLVTNIGLVLAKVSRLRHHKPTPEANPWRRTSGSSLDSSLKIRVHILSSLFPTTGPILTNLVLNGVLMSVIRRKNEYY